MSDNAEVPRLFKRQKLLLALLQKFGGKLSNTNLQKYLFLFTEICEEDKSYEFVPYKFGCFSFQSYADRRKLKSLGLLEDNDSWEIAASNTNFSKLLDTSTRNKLNLFKDKYRDLRGDALVKKVYRLYPYYATRSEIANSLMNKDELAEIENVRPKESGFAFFTIGYEGQSFEHYLNRLLKNNVHLLCDVRKNPLSRKYGFSKKTLSETLNKLGIEYLHVPELGIVSDKRRSLNLPSDYKALFDDYERTILKENTNSLDMLYSQFVEKKRVAITCFEAESCMCHRSRVAQELCRRPDWSYPINHI